MIPPLRGIYYKPRRSTKTIHKSMKLESIEPKDSGYKILLVRNWTGLFGYNSSDTQLKYSVNHMCNLNIL